MLRIAFKSFGHSHRRLLCQQLRSALRSHLSCGDPATLGPHAHSKKFGACRMTAETAQAILQLLLADSLAPRYRHNTERGSRRRRSRGRDDEEFFMPTVLAETCFKAVPRNSTTSTSKKKRRRKSRSEPGAGFRLSADLSIIVECAALCLRLTEQDEDDRTPSRGRNLDSSNATDHENAAKAAVRSMLMQLVAVLVRPKYAAHLLLVNDSDEGWSDDDALRLRVHGKQVCYRNEDNFY